jgi:hypothetical protein
LRRKPHHWPNHVSFRPMYNKSNAKSESSALVVTKAVYNSPNELHKINDPRAASSGLQVPPQSTTFGGKFTGGSFQKSFVQHELLNWTSFVQQKLYLENYDVNDHDFNRGRICQKGYSYISPCRRNTTYVPNGIRHIPRAFLRHLFASANDPVYELDDQGVPFDHLLQLRTTKIQNILHIPTYWDVSAFGIIHYEQLLNDMEGLLTQIGNAINQTIQCSVTTSSTKTPYRLPRSFRDWISNHADWRVEQLIGYNRRNSKQH